MSIQDPNDGRTDLKQPAITDWSRMPAVAPATRERLPLTEPACGWGDYSGALAEIRDDLAGWPKDARVQRLVAIADAEMAKPSHLYALLSTLAAHPSAAQAPVREPSKRCGCLFGQDCSWCRPAAPVRDDPQKL